MSADHGTPPVNRGYAYRETIGADGDGIPLADHLARYVPDNPTALVFSSPDGAPLRNGNFRRRIWHSAVEQAGLPQSLRIHDLRHTCASLLIAAGANPKPSKPTSATPRSQ